MADCLLSSRNLVLAVKKYPCLYDFQSRKYHRKQITEEAWQRVAEETGSSVTKCRRTWRNLRIVFTRHLKRPFQDKKYYLLDEMQFLSPFIANHRSNAQISVTPPILHCRSDNARDNSENNAVDKTEDNGSTIDISDSSISESYEELDEHVLNHSAKPLPVTSNDTANLSETREKLQDDNFMEKLEAIPQKLFTKNVQSFKSRETDNAKKMFLLSLLPDIEEMTDYQMRQFRTKVSILIGEIMDYDTSLKDRSNRSIFNNNGVQQNQSFRPIPNVYLGENIRRGQPEGNPNTSTGVFNYSFPIRTDNQRQPGSFHFNNSQNLMPGNNFN